MNIKIYTLSVILILVGIHTSGSAQTPANPATNGSSQPSYNIDIEMKPADKRPLRLKENERNPFEKRSAKDEEFTETDTDSEESKLREILTQLRVGGSSRGTNGLRILLGDMNLEEGMFLPKLIPVQNDALKVTEITEEALTLSWVDTESGVLTGKTLQLTFDLTPTIQYGLPGQPVILDTSGNPSPSTVMGVMRLGQERKKEAATLRANNTLRDIPREAIEAGQ